MINTAPHFLRVPFPAHGPCGVPSYAIWHGVNGRTFGSLHGLSVRRRVYRNHRRTYGQSWRDWGTGLIRFEEVV